MDNNKNDIDNIELRSEKVRHIIGQVPPALVRTGTMVITLVIIVLAVAFITIEGQDNDVASIVCPVTSHNDKLLIVDGNHYFAAKTFIHRYGSNAQPGLKVSARIVVSDKTVWQQIFRK